MPRSFNHRAQHLDTQGLETDYLKPSLTLDLSVLSVKWSDSINTHSLAELSEVQCDHLTGSPCTLVTINPSNDL